MSYFMIITLIMILCYIILNVLVFVSIDNKEMNYIYYRRISKNLMFFLFGLLVLNLITSMFIFSSLIPHDTKIILVFMSFAMVLFSTIITYTTINDLIYN
jgi:hypothetical protein